MYVPFRFILVASSNRTKRSILSDNDNDEIIYQRIPNAMHELLRVSRAIEMIESHLYDADEEEPTNSGGSRRTKRDTSNYLNNIIQVSENIKSKRVQSQLNHFFPFRIFKAQWKNSKHRLRLKKVLNTCIHRVNGTVPNVSLNRMAK